MNRLKIFYQKWSRHILWSLFVGWITGITILSSMSVPPMPEGLTEIIGMDKVAHFSAFTLGGVLLAWALHESTRWDRKKLMVVAICCLSIFGSLDEFHQLYTPGRSGADPLDWLADALGGSFGVYLVAFAYVRFRQNRPAAQTP